jgi:hypothetical protein
MDGGDHQLRPAAKANAVILESEGPEEEITRMGKEARERSRQRENVIQ